MNLTFALKSGFVLNACSVCHTASHHLSFMSTSVPYTPKRLSSDIRVSPFVSGLWLLAFSHIGLAFSVETLNGGKVPLMVIDSAVATYLKSNVVVKATST